MSRPTPSHNVRATDGMDDAAAVLGQSFVEEQTPAKELIRVLHVNSGNLYGGVETILVALARCGMCAPPWNRISRCVTKGA